MATLKAIVKTKTKSGMYTVYIRVTQKRSNSYIRTSWMVSERGLSKDKKDIIDPHVIQQTSALIDKYYQQLNVVDTYNWSSSEIVKYLLTGNEDISFTDFALERIDKMIQSGHERTSRNYKWALKHLQRYAGDEQIMFSRLTSSFLNRWIETLGNTSRCKEKYPVCMREVFKAAMKEYNDEEAGYIRIKNPWCNVTIPKSDTADKRAIDVEWLRKFFQVVPDKSRFTHPLMELGQDVALISFCLCGINAIDLFYAEKRQYSDGFFWYNRRKTMNAREDHAYFELKIPEFAKPTFEKYFSKDENSPFLFDFHERLKSADSFVANVNTGISQIWKKISPDFKASLYCFRHSWATIAQNECGASLAEVDFALNHSNHKMARVYVNLDFSPAWKLNDKVIDFVFFTDKKSTRVTQKEEKTFEKISKYNNVRGEAYVLGKLVCSLEDTGYTNVDQIMDDLVKSLPRKFRKETRVQFKIINIDKQQSQLYQRVLH